MALETISVWEKNTFNSDHTDKLIASQSRPNAQFGENGLVLTWLKGQIRSKRFLSLNCRSKTYR